MKHSLIILLHFFSVYSYGQFAIVLDKDSFVNVRVAGQANSKIVDSLKNGHLIYCFEYKGNWINIDYSGKSEELNGYIYKDRCKLISDYLRIPILTQTQNMVTLKKDTIEIILTQRKFDKSKHKFKYVKGYPGQIELIDNKQYWGMDGGMPRTEFDKIIIKFGHKTITLPKEAIEGLYEPSLYNAEANFDKQNNIMYIQTINSDGAGSYEVVWKIENGIYKDRFIAYGF